MLRPQHQGARDGDALALAAREHMRITAGEFGPQPDPFHRGAHGGLAVRGRHPRVDDQRFLERRADGLTRVERTIGVLEHHLDLAAQPLARLGIRTRHILALDVEPAAGGRLDQSQKPAQCGLAGTGFADDRERLASLERQRDPRQRPDHEPPA